MTFRDFMIRLLGPYAPAAAPRVEPEAPAPQLKPATGWEPPVCGDALLDLALVMRERYWPDAGFASDADRALASAALARCFPHYVETVERCPCAVEYGGDPAAVECGECATDADMQRWDGKLADYLAPLPRPAIIPPLTDALRALTQPGASFP